MLAGAGVLALTGCAPAALVDLPPPVDAPDLYVPVLEEDYRLQVGDVISIRSYSDPQLNQELIVRPDGRSSILLMDDVAVAGMTPAGLDALITDFYGGRLDSPEITVAVKTIASQQIYVGGEVGRPTVLAMSGQMSLLQAVTSAGGFLPGADLDQVVLMRRDASGYVQSFRVDAASALRGTGADPYLTRSDMVYVPRTGLARAADWVDRNINRLIPNAVLVQFGYVRSDTDTPDLVITPTAGSQ